MSVTVEQGQGALQRKIIVTCQWDEISSQVSNTLNDLKNKKKLPGFRLGKAPLSLIKAQYEKQVRTSVMFETVEKAYKSTLENEKLYPVRPPLLDLPEVKEGENLVCTLEIEIFPEIEIKDLSGHVIKADSAEVTDPDIELAIEKIRKQRQKFSSVERAAVLGDRLTIDFEGFLMPEKESFEGNKAENMELVLGDNKYISGFEEGLVGLKAGEEKTLHLAFPESYGADHLAGKSVDFYIKVHEVAEGTLPEIDEAFIKEFGVESGTFEDFKNELREEMIKEAQSAYHRNLKQLVWKHLLENYDFPIPETLFEEEKARLSEKKDNLTEEEIAKIADKAKENITFSLLFNELINKYEISLTDDLLNETMRRRFSAFSDLQFVLPLIRQNKKLMQEIQADALEDALLATLLTQISVEQNQVKFENFMEKYRGW